MASKETKLLSDLSCMTRVFETVFIFAGLDVVQYLPIKVSSFSFIWK